ncbi:SGNH/GDSL hydrolase family protein [Demequina sp. NBRC 110055]|uniref:SGNH/GDSL hydrolase family protein n=1 Tax=Demequina sp. NBRC 110055 TaxID=1570344 RepID=UPI00135634A6|nr:SGNH/GDSL hydrolase family protein [Demequina sp. NBRC 110055]
MAGERTLFAFGDSIVAGHLYPRDSFIDRAAARMDMTVSKFAVNGATVMPSENVVEDQVHSAPSTSPDIVVFDGGTNDAYARVLTHVGIPGAPFAPPGPRTTFAGAFEHLIAAITERYAEVPIVYVSAHTLAARPLAAQRAVRATALEVCSRHRIPVADVSLTALDTRDDEMRVAYSFDSLDETGRPGAATTTGAWFSDAGPRPTGTHPNIEAMDRFYVPAVVEAIRRLG